MEISITFMSVRLALALHVWEVTSCRPHILNEDSVYFPSAVWKQDFILKQAVTTSFHTLSILSNESMNLIHDSVYS
jgi:hypothetical protein